MNNTIRTFIAIKLDPNVLNVIEQSQNQLKKCDCNIKWIEPKNLHLTLKFIGNVNIKKIDAFTQTLAGLFQNIKPIESELTQLSAFPNIKHPRLLWIGLRDANNKIIQLAKLIENSLSKLDIQKSQKSFNPHITIGRLRSPKNIDLLSNAISNFSLPTGITQTFSVVVLYKSVLNSTGPIYTILKEFHLVSN